MLVEYPPRQYLELDDAFVVGYSVEMLMVRLASYVRCCVDVCSASVMVMRWFRLLIFRGNLARK